jgi:hypothetical protein
MVYTEIFTSQPTNDPDIAAIALERGYAENIGKRVDKLDKDYYNREHSHLDYFQLIERARSIDLDIEEKK